MTHKTRVIVLAAIAVLTACNSAESPQDSTDVTADASTPAPVLPETPAPQGATVSFIEPDDGARVNSPITVRFGASNVTIVPAGENAPSSGHHHLVVNAELPPAGLPIPKNEQYIHFGGGQTQTELELEPGEYTLTLVLGDHLHIPHVPMIHSETITIIVE